MRPFLKIVLAGLCSFLPATAAFALVYDEAELGDLPGSSIFGGIPPVLNLDFGLNEIIGTQQSSNFPPLNDIDAFRIQLPASLSLSTVTITASAQVTGGHPAGGILGFTTFYPDPPSAVPSIDDTHAKLFDGDLLTKALFEGQLPTASGGLHEILVEGAQESIDGSGVFDYAYSIQIVVIPEPSTAILLGLGLLGLRARTIR